MCLLAPATEGKTEPKQTASNRNEPCLWQYRTTPPLTDRTLHIPPYLARREDWMRLSILNKEINSKHTRHLLVRICRVLFQAAIFIQPTLTCIWEDPGETCLRTVKKVEEEDIVFF